MRAAKHRTWPRHIKRSIEPSRWRPTGQRLTTRPGNSGWGARTCRARAITSGAPASACRVSPSAFSNLGATLGELGEPEAALAAFEQALAADAENPTLLSNVGVVRRELGQLTASEEALRRVVALAPEFVFGHYNLGHTLFLSGRFEESLEAYLEGQRRDPDGNLRQACRLAMVRFAAGDLEGADRDLWRAADAASPEEREDLLLEAYEIGKAVLDAAPAPGPRQVFLDRLAAAIMA